jgi:hypothetical protein
MLVNLLRLAHIDQVLHESFRHGAAEFLMSGY